LSQDATSSPDIRELSTKEFDSNDTKGPKSVSTFIIKLSELEPRLVIKQMTLLAKQLDSEVCSLIQPKVTRLTISRRTRSVVR
jgi:hypothetical protein